MAGSTTGKSIKASFRLVKARSTRNIKNALAPSTRGCLKAERRFLTFIQGK